MSPRQGIDTLLTRLDQGKIVDLDLGSEEMRERALVDICAAWAKIPPFYVVNFDMPVVVIGRYTDCREAYLDDRLSSSPPDRPGFERFDVFHGNISVAQSDGDDHSRMRRLISPSFAPKIIRKFDENIWRIIASMLEEVEALGGPFDCMDDFATHLVVRVMLDGLFAISSEEQAAFVRMHQAMPLVADLAPGDDWPAAYLEAERDLRQVMDKLIADRRAHPREDDFLSTLVAARDNTDKLNDEELRGNIFAILAGGLSSTAVSAANMLMNLCKHRAQFNKVIADNTLIPQTVEECLRYQGPSFFSFARFATEDLEIGGTPILKDMPVIISHLAGNRDPQQFPNPLRFDILRNPKNILTFGTGVHHCIANQLGRKVLCVVLEQICQRFPNLRLQDPLFVPRYGGRLGALKPASVPMHTGR